MSFDFRGNLNTSTSFADSPFIDAFGRQRVSNPVSLFSSQLEYDKQPLLWVEKIVGTASATHVPAESSANLTLGTASGDRIVRQTIEYIRYQPGKSHAIKLTCVFGAEQSGTEKIVGYGDDDNGIFMGQDGGGMFALLRSSSSGSVSDARKFYQSNWNIDAMDGDGISGITLDETKGQLIFIDLEWLSLGRVRIGFIIGGLIYYVHEFLNGNIISLPYMTTANLPVRYEIRNTSVVASAPTLKQICSEVESEGGFEPDIQAYPFSTMLTNVTIPVGEVNAVLAFAARHSATFNGIENRGKFRPLSYGVLATGNTVFSQIIYNPTITSGTFGPVDPNSMIDGAIDVGINFSGGIPIESDATGGGGGNKTGPSTGKDFLSRLPFGHDVDGNNHTVLGLKVWASAAATADLTFKWDELR